MSRICKGVTPPAKQSVRSAAQHQASDEGTHDAVGLLASDKLNDDADLAVLVLGRVLLHDEPLELARVVPELLLLLRARALCRARDRSATKLDVHPTSDDRRGSGRRRTVLVELDDAERDDLVAVFDNVLHRPVERLGTALVG
jgi:hypothetical protein